MLQALHETNDFLALTLSCPRGEFSPFEYQLSDHTQVSVWDSGVIVFEPKLYHSTKDIVLSCAVHGNETAPIELCNDLVNQILKQEVVVQERVMFLIANPPAILNNTRFIDINLNRLFNGAHQQALPCAEAERAAKLEQYIEKFYSFSTKPALNQPAKPRQRMHYDLHTAIRSSKHEKFAIYPYRGDKKYRREQLLFLASSGIDTVLFHHEPTTTFSYYSSSKFDADAFTIELGKVFPMGENDMSKFAKLKQRLIELITKQEIEVNAAVESDMNLYQVCRSVNKTHEDFAFSFETNVENFTTFTKGTVLATEADCDICVEQDEEAIVFPNANVPIGQRTVLCLTAVDSNMLDKLLD